MKSIVRFFLKIQKILEDSASFTLVVLLSTDSQFVILYFVSSLNLKHKTPFFLISGVSRP